MIGRVLTWGESYAAASGLPGVAQGELVEAGGALAMVTALRSDRVELAPLTAQRAPVGAEVRPLGQLALEVERDPMAFHAPWRRLVLGTLVYDLQRQLALGASIVATGSRAVLPALLKQQVALGRSVVRVGFTAGAAPAQQWLAPWHAMAAASDLRFENRDVIVVLEDLESWRPHVETFPARGQWATQLAQLASRAYAYAAGSVTLLALADTVTPAIACAFDDVLDLDLALRGEVPVRRTKLVRPPFQFGHAQLARAIWNEPQTGAALRHLLGTDADSLEQELGLLAVFARGGTAGLSASAVPAILDDYLAELRRTHAALLAEIRAGGANRRVTDAEVELLLAPVGN